MKKQWLLFLLTRFVGLGADTVLLGGAYLAAVILRFDFREPQWGWGATALSFGTVWLVQIVGLVAAGCYRLPWRRTGILDLPRYVAAFGASAAVLAFMRWQMPDMSLAHIRPPYSITLMATVLGFCAVVGVRLLWRLYHTARRDEKKLLHRLERKMGGERVVEMLRGKTVLVTGAGGSIGSEIIRQVACNGASCIVLVERSENALYEIDREMRCAQMNCEIVSEMADIADEVRMRGILAKWKPQIVLHAAAYKHVPLVEMNPVEGLRNNALATRHLGVWCGEAGVVKFVMISTDKAVNPISVMGMTKRLAEVLLLQLNASDASRPVSGGASTRYSCVRFGNVLGSSGSVVPLFREQIAHHGPVTVTHPDMRRYFMSVEEAVGLVLEAAVQEGNCIYTLDMGKPVRIMDLAEDMIRQAGYKPYVDIPIVITGMRPGEKLFEELDVSERSAYKTENARIFICKAAGRGDDVTLKEVENFVSGHPSREDVKRWLAARVGGGDTGRSPGTSCAQGS